MIGTTLGDIRDHIETLASDEGEYYLVCGRSGDRPVPAAELRFESRATASAAARATEQYRAALRRYDPRLPRYDVIVCQATTPGDARPADGGCPSAETGEDPTAWTLSEPVLERGVDRRDRHGRVEFCHRVAGAVFETLSSHGHDAVESAVMDAYFDLAETLADPDDLCLCLLESMATELDRRLSPTDQAEALAGAATRLPSPGSGSPARPVAATLGLLAERGLLDGYAQSPWSADSGGRRSVTVRVSGYALSPRDGRLPVLPLVVELYRHGPDRPPSSLRVVDVDDGWHFTLVLAREVGQTGLASAPIRPEV